MSKTLTWTVVVLIVIIGGALLFTGDAPEEVQAPQQNNTVSPITLEGDNAIFVRDQNASENVTVAFSVLADPGYIVIHEDEDGSPGAVIGHSERIEGETSNVTVPLERTAQKGETLWAMLHTDDGDGVYNFPGDDVPVKDGQGNIVMMAFNVGEEVMTEEDAMMNEDANGAVVQITYTDSGFSPSPVTISTGDTVSFVNNSSRDVWPASAMHPTHTVYPGTSIQDCGTSAEESMFDACGALSSGGTYSFTFTETGEWGYHNHLQASHTGQIIVQ